MIKSMLLIARRTDISSEQFHRHWRDVHGPLALRISALRRYVQSHRLPAFATGFKPVEHEGIAEVWVDDLHVASNLSSDPEFFEHAGKDEPNFMDRAASVALRCTEQVLIDAAGAVPSIKLAVFVAARPGWGPDLDGWLQDGLLRHGRELPGLQHLSVDRPAGTRPPAYAAVIELCWPDLAAYHQAWASRQRQLLLRELAVAADLTASRAGVFEQYRLL